MTTKSVIKVTLLDAVIVSHLYGGFCWLAHMSQLHKDIYRQHLPLDITFHLQTSQEGHVWSNSIGLLHSDYRAMWINFTHLLSTEESFEVKNDNLNFEFLNSNLKFWTRLHLTHVKRVKRKKRIPALPIVMLINLIHFVGFELHSQLYIHY